MDKCVFLSLPLNNGRDLLESRTVAQCQNQTHAARQGTQRTIANRVQAMTAPRKNPMLAGRVHVGRTTVIPLAFKDLEAAMSFDLKELNRRGAIAYTAAIATGVLAGGRGMHVPAHASDKTNPAGDDEISATEDLMREHGVLRRALIVYGELASRLQAGRR